MITQLIEAHIFLPKRLRTTHKGELGHVLVVGGDYGMPGSVRMAAEAALRCGSGLVTVATRPEHVAMVVSARPELMCYGIQHSDELTPLLERASVVIVGPGMTQSDWSRDLITRVFNASLPMIIDAGALHYVPLSKQTFPHAIFTPHPGEMARLLGKDIETIQQNRFTAATEAQSKFGGVFVLKGAGSLTVTEGHSPEICVAGNPGMATAGMGDVLNGVIAGLLAQGLDPFDAARFGVILHARSGDLAERDVGECGLLATDLFPYLRKLMNPWVDLRAQLESLEDEDEFSGPWDELSSEDNADDNPDESDSDDNEILH